MAVIKAALLFALTVPFSSIETPTNGFRNLTPDLYPEVASLSSRAADLSNSISILGTDSVSQVQLTTNLESFAYWVQSNFATSQALAQAQFDFSSLTNVGIPMKTNVSFVTMSNHVDVHNFTWSLYRIPLWCNRISFKMSGSAGERNDYGSVPYGGSVLGYVDVIPSTSIAPGGFLTLRAAQGYSSGSSFGGQVLFARGTFGGGGNRGGDLSLAVAGDVFSAYPNLPYGALYGISVPGDHAYQSSVLLTSSKVIAVAAGGGGSMSNYPVFNQFTGTPIYYSKGGYGGSWEAAGHMAGQRPYYRYTTGTNVYDNTAINIYGGVGSAGGTVSCAGSFTNMLMYFPGSSGTNFMGGNSTSGGGGGAGYPGGGGGGSAAFIPTGEVSHRYHGAGGAGGKSYVGGFSGGAVQTDGYSYGTGDSGFFEMYVTGEQAVTNIVPDI